MSTDEIKDAMPEPSTLEERLRYALAWCSAASDFAPDGQARVGWEKIVKPLLVET